MIDLDRLVPILPDYLARQRWHAGERPASVEVVETAMLRQPWPALVSVLVLADGELYQLVIGLRPLGAQPDFLQGHDYAVFGELPTEAGDSLAYDALIDQDLALFLLEIVTEGAETARWARPVTAEQSNTSVIYEDRLIFKVFRRLYEGENPDAEVSLALDEVGFNHIPDPVAVWQREGRVLGVVQAFLASGTEGWALAMTSLRDLYASPRDPSRAGGDFANEAERVGEMTAKMHLALAEAFGVEDADVGSWAAMMEDQLRRVAADEPWRARAEALFHRVRELGDAGVSIRVHGDYHLGQVMRTDVGWYVLDFEGEPSRPVPERRQKTCPIKDVAGMLRSFHYASRLALVERGEGERADLEPLAAAWEARNRGAFLTGYREAKGIDALLPADEGGSDLLTVAFELDKAVYELAYERAYRPDWEWVPRQAVERMVSP